MDQESKYPPAYWEEYSSRIISELGLKKTAQGEYHGACPNCGGKDRFWINQKDGLVKVHCRQCSDFQAIADRLRSSSLMPQINEKPQAPRAVDHFKSVDDGQPYHMRKGIQLHGATLDGTDVVVKIINAEGKQTGSQFISPDGKKLFNSGFKKDGSFSVLGGKIDGKCYIAEGFATAASVTEATGRPCIFALDAGNLPKVAQIVKEKKPDVDLIVAADHDEKGIKAAKETGLKYALPPKDMDFNDLAQAQGAEAVRKYLAKSQRTKELFVPIGDLEFKKPQWIIDGLLEQNSFAVCFGPPAAGKTFLTLDMALCIASGKPFHEKPVKQGAVYYIAGEGHNGFARRAAAWSKANGVSLKDLRFFKSNRSVILTEPETVESLKETITQMAEQHGPPQLIVIDTLARALGAADENSTKEMGGFIAVMDDLKDTYQATVLAVHHTGHGNKDRARGSSSLLGAVDAEFMVSKWDTNKIEVKFTKMKDAQTPEPMNFLQMEIDLVGSDMQETSSIVLDYTADGRPDKQTGLSSKASLLLEIIKENLKDGWVSDDIVRNFFKLRCGQENEGTQRTYYNAAKKELRSEGEIIEENQGFSLERN